MGGGGEESNQALSTYGLGADMNCLSVIGRLSFLSRSWSTEYSRPGKKKTGLGFLLWWRLFHVSTCKYSNYMYFTDTSMLRLYIIIDKRIYKYQKYGVQ